MSGSLVRRVFVSVSMVLCLAGFLVGSGILSKGVSKQAQGSLTSQATLIAPAGTAFSIWSVIYLGLVTYTVWQWFPSQAHHPRHAAVGWLAGITMLLNALWLFVTQLDLMWVSVGVIIVLVLALGLLVDRLQHLPPTTTADRIVTDFTFSLYLGWVTVAVCANIAAAFDASGWPYGQDVNRWVTVAVIVVATLIALALAWRLGARLGVALAITWGLLWIAVARLDDAPRDTVVGIAAAVAAIVVLAGTVLIRSVVRPLAPSDSVPEGTGSERGR